MLHIGSVIICLTMVIFLKHVFKGIFRLNKLIFLYKECTLFWDRGHKKQVPLNGRIILLHFNYMYMKDRIMGESRGTSRFL